MRPCLPLLALALAACAPKARAPVDPTLPEASQQVEVKAPLVVLEEASASLDPQARARALALMLRVTDDLEAWGPRALYDPSTWVQRGAVESLARRLPEVQSLELLHGYVLRDDADPYVRGLAALRLPTGRPDATASLSSAWRAAAEPWERAPLALAAVAHGDADALSPLGEALSSGELPLDVPFLIEVGASGHEELVPALREAQDRVERELVLPVAVARLMLGDASGEQPLRKALGDPDVQRRLEAVDYLVDLDHPAAETLLRKARSQGPDLVRWYAELALSARQGSNLELFHRALAEPDRELRLLAVRLASEAALDHAPHRKVVRSARQVLLAALADPDAAVRAEAIRAVAAQRMVEAIEPLRGLLADEVPAVRLEAAGALLQLAPKGG